MEESSVPIQPRHFTLLAERLCLDFTNTVGDHAADQPFEYLHGYADLVSWSQQAGILSAAESDYLNVQAALAPAQAADVLNRALLLREAIYRIFSALPANAAPPSADLALLNAVLDEHPVHLHVIAEQGKFACDWQADKSALDGFLAPIAWSAATLLASDELHWVKQCADDACGWLFLDTTKNHSRRWCDMSDCGSRAKAKRYYQRQRAK